MGWGESYPSAEIQSMYSADPADWAFILSSEKIWVRLSGFFCGFFFVFFCFVLFFLGGNINTIGLFIAKSIVLEK